MGLKWTESWMSHAIGSYSVASAVTATPGTDFSSAVWVSAYNALDWKFYIRGNNATNGLVQVALVQDQIEATKQRMYLRSYNTSATSYYSQVFMTTIRTMPTKYIYGSLIRLQSASKGGVISFNGYGASAGLGTSSSATPSASHGSVLIFTKASATDTEGWTISSYATGSLVSYSTVTLYSDTDYYLEMQVDTTANTFRVWIDDLLIIDVTLATAVSALMTSGIVWFVGLTTSSGTAGTAYGMGIYLSDIYLIDATDTVAPYTRLGKTTRVRGEKPTSDYSVQMGLPDGYTSHYDVVDDQISSTSAPTAYLTAETAGTRDIFGTSSDATSYAAAVHGVVIKSVSGNYGETSHTIGGVMSDGTTEAVVNMATLAAASGWDAIMSVHPTAPDGTSWTPAKVAAVKFGVELVS